MITLRKAQERHHERSRKEEVWRTFNPEDRADSLADGFGTLEFLDEYRIPPGAGVPRGRHHEAEVVTYVRDGTLRHEDSMQAGEFRRRAGGPGLRRGETNGSRTDWAHVFQIWLRTSDTALETGHEQKRFSAAERRGGLCLVASPDARRGSLLIHQDVLVYSAMLYVGQHVAHELLPGRKAWLHLVQGDATIGDVALRAGDGIGVTDERSLSFTARSETEVLLLDIGEEAPKPNENGSAARRGERKGLL